jgi:hypothetical protein
LAYTANLVDLVPLANTNGICRENKEMQSLMFIHDLSCTVMNIDERSEKLTA